MSAQRFVLGVDVGGTFTDIALVRMEDGAGFYNKISSTPDDPARAVIAGISELLAATKIKPGDIDYFGHGTTVATNAVIAGTLARTGMITTKGFRDLLEIRRQRKPHNYDLRLPKPPPLVARHLRHEIVERTYLTGPKNVAPELAALDSIFDDFERQAVESIAICFLHSYHNPSHEQAVALAVRKRFPGVFVCTSHEVMAEFREYERITTTVVNAALGPVMSRYLTRLEQQATALGLRRPSILQSNGGVASPQEASSKAVRTLASGPAAGVTGAARLAKEAGIADIITFDVGGTSTDVCLVEGGRPLIAREREFHGHPVRFPMIDVDSVGAGGGSIAWIDGGGFLQVGPQSAGANPGPACYGLGGASPTVTDANVVLGRLPPDALLRGRLPIRAELARRAIQEKIADPMGLSVEDAAQGILTILNEHLVQAIRVISVEQGFDHRRFTLVAFGGAGPLLASALARELGMNRIFVPQRPGLLCALGLLMADVRSDFSRTRIAVLDEDAAATINASFAEIENDVAAWFEREDISCERRMIERAIDMRYVGQSHELTIPVDNGAIGKAGVAVIADAFRREHERIYGYAPEAPVQLVTFRATARARIETPTLSEGGPPPGNLELALVGRRPVHFRERGGFTDCAIYDRTLIPRGTTILGPAIIEQMDTTTVLLPEQNAHSDEAGRLILTFSS